MNHKLKRCGRCDACQTVGRARRIFLNKGPLGLLSFGHICRTNPCWETLPDSWQSNENAEPII